MDGKHELLSNMSFILWKIQTLRKSLMSPLDTNPGISVNHPVAIRLLATRIKRQKCHIWDAGVRLVRTDPHQLMTNAVLKCQVMTLHQVKSLKKYVIHL